MMTFCGKKTQWESFTWHESLFESRVLHFDIFDGAPLVTRGIWRPSIGDSWTIRSRSMQQLLNEGRNEGRVTLLAKTSQPFHFLWMPPLNRVTT